MKYILSIILPLLPLVANADAVEINGIFYTLVSKAKAAEVTSNPNKYSGEIVIPESITYNDITYNVINIGASAFSGCKLESVSIPNSVTSIKQYAFSNCKLTSVVIPNPVTNIGIGAFKNCNLMSVTLPNTIISIDNDAFSGCDNLQEVHIHNLSSWYNISFGNIESNPLHHAHHLYLDEKEIVEIEIPDGITTIGNYLFEGLSQLSSISIPSSVKSIGSAAFYGCNGLKSVHITDLNAWLNIDFRMYDSNPLYYAQHLYLNGEEINEIEIPSNITVIGNYVFSGFSALKSIYLPNSVISIGNSSFKGCSGLSKVIIPENVKEIGERAFSECNGLTNIIIPSSVEFIDQCAFYKCNNLSSIVMKSAVNYLGDAVFAECPEIEDFYCFADRVRYGVDYLFDGSYIDYATLHVPADLVEGYKKASTWSNFMKIVPIEKCAVPSITYKDGELTFDCKTENVEFISSVKIAGASGIGNNIEVRPIMNVSVYATSDYHYNSDVATKEIDLSKTKYDVNNDDNVDNEDLNRLIGILLGQ